MTGQMRLTRRKLGTVLTGLALGPAAAQVQAQPSPAGELQAAKDRVKARSELLTKQEVAMTVEPAFQFRA
jgi:hypothetical protein